MAVRNPLSLEIRELVKRGLELNRWLTNRMVGLEIPESRRFVFAVTSFELVIEHHFAICQLVNMKTCGSAFALVRPVFEGYIRGVWLLNCATENQLSVFQSDKKLPGLEELIKKIEESKGFESGLLMKTKNESWSAMNSYTHGGIMQLSRRHTRHTIETVYKDRELVEMLRIAGAFSLQSFQQIAGIAGATELASQAHDLLVTHIKEHKQ